MATPVQRVGGAVLAAGRSARMGQPKPLLPAGSRSFMAACVEALRQGGCDPVVAVVGDAVSGGEDAAEEARVAGAVVVWNRAPASEQIDSLRIGLERLEMMEPELEAILVLPVDHPLVRPETVRALLDAAAEAPDAAVRPVHDGRPGHPTLFPRPLWSALADPDLPDGARSVLESDGASVRDVSVDDPGVVADIDTPDAFRDALGGPVP